MPTTVIASSAGFSLYLAPWASGKVDMVAVNAVLLRHGLQARGTEQPNLEFIAAEGLETEAARALATDLREVGLNVRVRKKVGLERSSRVGDALAGNYLVAAIAIGIGSTLLGTGSGPEAALLLLPLLAAAANLIAISMKGSGTLELASKPAESHGQVSRALLEMRHELPDGLFTSLLIQAQDLEAKVANNPDGQAAQELEELAASLRDHQDAEAVDQVSELKQELAQARKAIAEAKRGAQKH
ncbi:MAG: hypothetical protein ACI9VR_001641 [Cognaticolwellia sp.]|jgi:hypothetical protein